MNPLLDTVEPDATAFLTEDGECIALNSGRPPLPTGYIEMHLYFGHKIEARMEALLAECRKQARQEALLDAVQVVIRNAIPYENTANDSADQLRRMAEGEKNEQ